MDPTLEDKDKTPTKAASSNWNGFQGVRYFVNPSLSALSQSSIKKILTSSGAVELPLLPSTTPLAESSAGNSQERKQPQPRFDLDQVTHVISDTEDFVEFSMLEKRMQDGTVHIVTPAWVTKSYLTRLVQDPRFFSVDPSKIFSGVCIACMADIKQGDREFIAGAVGAMGGQMKPIVTMEVTHIVTLAPDQNSFDIVNGPKTGIKFVLPHWVYECLKVRQILPTSFYQFTAWNIDPPILDSARLADPTKSLETYHNEYIKANTTYGLENGTDAAKEKISLFSTTGDPRETENSEGVKIKRKRTDSDIGNGHNLTTGVKVFAGKNVLLGCQLGIDDSARTALNSWIQTAGGYALQFEEEMSECDVYITRWRDGREYLQAVQSGKTVATLSWFYHVIKVQRLTSPKDQLLHYPVPKDPIVGYEKQRISVTNYSGETRDYLKKLIQAMGLEFTTTLSTDNTHLVAANLEGQKCSRASHWRLPVINHFWLEDCFKAWELIPPTSSRYIEFPKGVHYATLLGNAKLSEDDISRWTNKELSALVEPAEAEVEEDVEMGDVEDDLRVASVATPVEEPVKTQIKKATSGSNPRIKPVVDSGKIVPRAGAKKASVRVKKEQDAEGSKAGPVPARMRDPSPTSSEGGMSVNLGGVDLNNVMAAGSSRSAKRQALANVHVAAQDMYEYQKGKGRKDIVSPKSRKQCRLPTPHPKSGTDAEMTEEEEEEEAARDVTPIAIKRGRKRHSDEAIKLEKSGSKKKQRGASVTSSKKEVVQGRTRSRSVSVREDLSTVRYLTTGNKLPEETYQAFIKLGAVRANGPEDCTHLVIGELKRTLKLLQCLPLARVVCHENWVRACVEEQDLDLDPSHYPVKDPAAEKKWRFVLADSVRRAEEVKESGVNLLQGHTIYLTPNVENVETAMEVARTAGGEAVKYSKNHRKDLLLPNSHLISCDKDRYQTKWDDLVRDHGITVYDKEFILTSVLRMEVNWETTEEGMVIGRLGEGEFVDDDVRMGE